MASSEQETHPARILPPAHPRRASGPRRPGPPCHEQPKNRGGHPGHDQGRRQSIPQVVAPRRACARSFREPRLREARRPYRSSRCMPMSWWRGGILRAPSRLSRRRAMRRGFRGTPADTLAESRGS